MEFKTFFHLIGDKADVETRKLLTAEENSNLNAYFTGRKILKDPNYEMTMIGIESIARGLEPLKKYEKLRIEVLGTFFSEDV